MKLNYVLLFTIFMNMGMLIAQNDFFKSIPDYSSIEVNERTMMMRMIDGLGFRYYHASNNLKMEDLNYRISEGARNTEETLQHIYDLSKAILVFTENSSNGTFNKEEGYPEYEELRRVTLQNLEVARNTLKEMSEIGFKKLRVRFTKRGFPKPMEFPMWNIINGQISDAIYHTGQIVVFRRASGNPIQEGINVFLGK